MQVAHCPPYKSKYDPIEHRMFPHVDRSYRGVILEVTASIVRGVYETGRKFAADALDNIRCIANRILPVWNYRVEPQTN